MVQLSLFAAPYEYIHKREVYKLSNLLIEVGGLFVGMQFFFHILIYTTESAFIKGSIVQNLYKVRDIGVTQQNTSGSPYNDRYEMLKD